MTDPAPATDWQEVVAADEDTRFELYAERLVTLQREHADGGAVVRRALHAKGHGLFEASLEVAGDVPEHARHGLFAKPATYEALVRFSNGSGKLQADTAGDVRGIAIKVLGVGGDKVLGNAATQDLLGVLSPAVPFRNPEEFVAVVWALRAPALALFRIIGSVGLVRGVALVRQLAGALRAPPASLASKRFYSALPIQCGPHAVRFALTLVADASTGELSTGPDHHREDLTARLQRDAIAYDLGLQFFVDEVRTPIEDASVNWDEAVAPYVQVGRLSIGRQDATSERGKRLAERGERLAFDPWHALVAHRPLGAMMRARKRVYFASTQTRQAAAEPTSIAALLV